MKDAINDARARELHKAGTPDTQIAEACGVTPEDVWCWRHANKLPANPGRVKGNHPNLRRVALHRTEARG